MASDPVSKQRFEREAKALAALNHPHICQIFDVGHAEVGGEPVHFLRWVCQCPRTSAAPRFIATRTRTQKSSPLIWRVEAPCSA